MLRCHIPLSGVEIPTLAGACIPTIESTERTGYPVVCIFLLQHISAHEAYGRFVKKFCGSGVEVGCGEKTEWRLQQPEIVPLVIAYHTQIVPPRIGIVLVCERQRSMFQRGKSHQERRTQTHTREGEQQQETK